MSSNHNPVPKYTLEPGHDSSVTPKQFFDKKRNCTYTNRTGKYPLSDGGKLFVSSNIGQKTFYQQMNVVHNDRSMAAIQVERLKGEVMYREYASDGKVLKTKKITNNPEFVEFLGMMIDEGVLDQRMLTFKEAEAALGVHGLLKRVMDDEVVSKKELFEVYDACAADPISPVPTPKSKVTTPKTFRL